MIDYGLSSISLQSAFLGASRPGAAVSLKSESVEAALPQGQCEACLTGSGTLNCILLNVTSPQCSL